MVIIGKADTVVRPTGVIRGPAGNIEIATLSCSFAVGTIPVCRVGIPPEALSKLEDSQSNQIYDVLVGDRQPEFLMFRGYLAGESGKIQGDSISAGIDLVHIARDLDQMRISAPSLHPASILDYNYTYRGDTTTGSGAEGGFIFEGESFFKPGGGMLSKQIVNGLIKILTTTLSERSQGVGGDGGPKIEAFAPVIQALNSIKHLNSTIKGAIEGPLSTQDNNSINTWARARAAGSFNSMRSVWDTLTTIFAEFGVHLVCDNAGNIWAMADCAGFKPSGNELLPTYIGSFDHSSALFRNIKEVNLITDQIRNESSTGGGTAGTLVTYPPESKDVGASMAVQMPGWLNPIASTGSSVGAADAQREFAKCQYFLERNKMRTIAVTGPLAPRVVPGTVARIVPYSAIKPFSGQKLEPLTRTYVGYCYQVNHFIDVASHVMQTTFYFRNVSNEADKEVLTTHPIFSDVTPHVWV